jgi:hypothetical protein
MLRPVSHSLYNHTSYCDRSNLPDRAARTLSAKQGCTVGQVRLHWHERKLRNDSQTCPRRTPSRPFCLSGQVPGQSQRLLAKGWTYEVTSDFAATERQTCSMLSQAHLQ